MNDMETLSRQNRPVYWSRNCRQGDRSDVRSQRGLVQEKWPNCEEWKALLPAWFVSASDEALDAIPYDWFVPDLEASSASELSCEVHTMERWYPCSWACYLDPNDRHWYWWGVEFDNQGMAKLWVAVEDDPFAAGALFWLLVASGARGLVSDMPWAFALGYILV